jgi:DNA-binding XRE family transcriptional regulator
MTEVHEVGRDVGANFGLKRIRGDLGLSRERMARLLDVSSKTVERWEVQGIVPTNRLAIERLVAIGRLVDLGKQVDSLDALRAFLVTPMPVFDGHTALDMIELGRSDLVLGEIVADYEGAGY